MRQQFLAVGDAANLRRGSRASSPLWLPAAFCRRLYSWGSDMAGTTPEWKNHRAPHHVSHLTRAYGSFVLMRDLNFTINDGDVFIIWAAAGAARAPCSDI